MAKAKKGKKGPPHQSAPYIKADCGVRVSVCNVSAFNIALAVNQLVIGVSNDQSPGH